MERQTQLGSLFTEVKRQLQSRRDFVAPAPAITMTPSTDLTVGGNPFGMRPWAHNQLSQYLDVPGRFYDRLKLNEPQLLATTVNTLLSRQTQAQRTVRTLDGHVRAIVSPKFFALDNYDMLEAILPTVEKLGATIKNAQLTERHIYIVATLDSLRMDVPGSRRVGDIVEGGVIWSNSEIGDGTLYARGYLNFLVCLNGAVREDASFKRYHVGKSVEADADVRELLSNEARLADAKAIFLKLRDVSMALFDQTMFRSYVTKLGEATQDAIPVRNADKVVEVAVKELDLPEKSKGGILEELIKSGDFSRYGLLNAITFQAHEEPDAEEAIAYEKAGGKVIELPVTKWRRIAEGREATKQEQRAEASVAA